jgi:hypothetical protein
MQNKKLILAGLAGMVAGALVACGGGGGSSPSSGSGSASGVTLSGTAASGLAIAGGTVSISCQGATGSATTQTNGTYIVTVSGGSLPCALSVTSGGQTYRSVVAGTGSSATANITPLTEMLVGALLQQNPTALDGGAPSTTVTSSALQVAQTAVINYLQANDIDVSALSGTDFVSTPLVAATTTPGTGDAQDQVLDTLKAANVNPSAVATVLQSAPSGCAFAKSGKYTLINYLGEVSSATVDFTTNTIALGTSAPVSFSASSTYPCEYVAGTTTVNFASSGLAIYKDTTDNVIGIALPTQAFSTSLYGDTYNLSGYFAANSGPFALNTGNSTNDQLPNAQIATMKIGTDRSVIICADSTTTTCSDGSDSISATVNGDGSVDLLESGATTSTDKVYTYVAPNGKKLLVLANASTKSFLIGAKQEAIDPAKIEPNAVWFQVQGYAGYSGSGWSGATVASGTSVTTAITATQGTVTQHFDDGTAARDDIMLWNTTTGSDTWNGMRHRNAVTSPTNVAARTGLSAIGMGFATSGSVNGGTPAAPLLPSGKPGFTMSVKRIVQ